MVRYPLVSIVIQNYKGLPFIEDCIKSILKSRYPRKEIIVIHSKFDDGCKELILKKFSRLKNFKFKEIPTNWGPDRGRNTGAAMARGKYLVFLDNDTEVDRNWLVELVKVMEGDSSIGEAQSKLLKLQPKDQYDCAGDYLGPLGFLVERSGEKKDRGQFDYQADIFSAKSASIIVRNSLFKKIKGFDEDFFMYLEETDLSWRIWLAGFRVVFVPTSIVYHAYGTTKKNPKVYYQKSRFRYYGCRNYIMTMIKNLGTKRIIWMLPVQVGCWTILMLSAFVKGSFDDGFYIFKGIGWNLVHPGFLWRKRRQIQNKLRRVSDDKIFDKVMYRQPPSYYFKKFLNYLSI